jgi:hypothetical protein
MPRTTILFVSIIRHIPLIFSDLRIGLRQLRRFRATSAIGLMLTPQRLPCIQGSQPAGG